jgi:hypothetical protein
MAEMKKSATMNEIDTNKVFLDTEKKESIQAEMISVEPTVYNKGSPRFFLKQFG